MNRIDARNGKWRRTTVIAVKRNGAIAICGDGQVSLGETIMKGTTRKVVRLFHDRVVAGFAGSAADGLSLLEKFEGKIEQAHGNLRNAAREFAKEWRSDKILRRLEALLVVADKDTLLMVSGGGDIIEPDDGLCAIGSGGNFALAAARAMARETTLSAEEIARKSLQIASEICVYTNDHITCEVVQ